jgi:hypothetical protein
VVVARRRSRTGYVVMDADEVTVVVDSSMPLKDERTPLMA